MKKEYISPSSKTYRLQITTMIATSGKETEEGIITDGEQDEVTEEGDVGSRQGSNNIWSNEW